MFINKIKISPLWQKTQKNNSVNVGFEETLWTAADKMRNNMDPSEYKHVVLGLIFLKYISDSFSKQCKQIMTDPDYYDGLDEDKDAYAQDGVFWVPTTARWGFLQNNAKKPEISTIVDNAMIAIEKENPYSKAKIVINTRILDDSVSRVIIEVKGYINPTTYKIIKKHRDQFAGDQIICELLNTAVYDGQGYGYHIATNSEEFDGKESMKRAQARLEYMKKAIIKMHRFVIDYLKK